MKHKLGSQLTAKKNILIEANFQGTQETALPASNSRRKETNRKKSTTTPSYKCRPRNALTFPVTLLRVTFVKSLVL